MGYQTTLLQILRDLFLKFTRAAAFFSGHTLILHTHTTEKLLWTKFVTDDCIYIPSAAVVFAMFEHTVFLILLSVKLLSLEERVTRT